MGVKKVDEGEVTGSTSVGKRSLYKAVGFHRRMLPAESKREKIVDII